jgi:hypothetical protein
MPGLPSAWRRFSKERTSRNSCRLKLLTIEGVRGGHSISIRRSSSGDGDTPSPTIHARSAKPRPIRKLERCVSAPLALPAGPLHRIAPSKNQAPPVRRRSKTQPGLYFCANQLRLARRLRNSFASLAARHQPPKSTRTSRPGQKSVASVRWSGRARPKRTRNLHRSPTRYWRRAQLVSPDRTGR